MHELAIAQQIIEIIEREAAKNKIAKVKVARLKVGQMGAFHKEQLEFCLASYEKKPMLDGMRFEIDEVPVTLACSACGKHFRDGRFDDHDFAHEVAHVPALYEPPACPACGAAKVAIATGQEMELTSIEGE